MSKLLEVEDLFVRFRTDEGEVHAVNGVSLEVDAGETLGIVGESGSGKSVSCLATMGLIPTPPGRITNGRAVFQGRDLLTLPREELRKVRGNRIAMIFQDPMSSLNPFLTVAEQLTEVTRIHRGWGRRQALDHAVEMLQRVGIPAAERRVFDYPHQFSGGMRQRVMIAMGLSCEPDLLIADEPTTALDVTIQAQILELLQELQRDTGMAIILITHDLGVIANLCHRVHVMYAGRVVESSPAGDLFREPLHPYTVGLRASVPRIDGDKGQSLVPIDGQPPDLVDLADGCAFHPRCPWAMPRCTGFTPPLYTLPKQAGRRHACIVRHEVGKLPELAATGEASS